MHGIIYKEVTIQAPNARVLYCFIETTPPHSMCIIPSTAMSLRIMSDVFDGCVYACIICGLCILYNRMCINKILLL